MTDEELKERIASIAEDLFDITVVPFETHEEYVKRLKSNPPAFGSDPIDHGDMDAAMKHLGLVETK